MKWLGIAVSKVDLDALSETADTVRKINENKNPGRARALGRA
jgi:hypothetical protein